MSLIDETLAALAERSLDEEIVDLVLAALGGEDSLAAALEGREVARPVHTETASETVEAPGAYLSSIEVEGFRGIGPASKLELEPGPGLTVVVGRNGSGKSSFAEALEVLLTGDSYRWKGKPVEWKQGWRNLHSSEGPSVTARFTVEGEAHPTVMSCVWDADAKEASDGSTVVQVHGKSPTDLAGFGWAEAVELHRPLLSHSELSVVADNPSTLFDALSGVLGLDELVDGTDLLRRRRLELEKPLKTVKKQIKDELLPALAESDDERAGIIAEALSGRKWDLETAAATAAGARPANGSSSLDGVLRLRLPEVNQIGAIAAELEAAAARLAGLEDTEAGRSRRTIDILETALAEHADHGDQACPVCGWGRLDAEWRDKAEAQVDELRRRSADYDTASAAVHEATRRARALVSPVPTELSRAPEELESEACRKAWDRWAQAPEETSELVEHLRSAFPLVAGELEQLQKRAAALKADREDAWRPLALRVASVVERAREALAQDEQAKQLKRAEDALAEATTDIRSRRFQPIADQAISLWEALRLQSNVELVGVELTGSRNRRRVDLSVEVDGADGAALGVVSQGEVNCLALSLFFPRVMLPDSPFRFIVIDDPVQAMDPARVDGLARVFARIAETRQLVVFTHDDRLPSSLQRLQIPHTTLQVTRRPGSIVEVRRTVDPVNQYFRDAWAIDKDEDLPDGVASRVVPGLCRLGIEAACVEAVRRRRIGRGDSHTAVEQELAEAKGTTTLAALALFDDASQGGKVLGEINRKWGKSAGDVFQDVKAGAHRGFHGNLASLVKEAQKLATGLRAQ